MKRAWLDELLDHLQGQLDMNAAQRARLLMESQTPWWLSALLGLAAWIASILFIVSFLGPWLVMVEAPIGRGIAGVLLILAALWMFRRQQPFTDQVGLVMSLTGQGVLVFMLGEQISMGQDTLRPLAVFSMLLAGTLLWLPSSFLHRHVCALLVLASAGVLIGAGVGLAIYCVLLAAVACALWLCRDRWVTHSQAVQIRALVDAATLISLLLAVHAHTHMAEELFDFHLPAAGHWTGIVYPAGIGAVLLCVVIWLVRHMTGPRYWLALVVTALLVALASPAPGFLLSLALGFAVFRASSRSWLVLMPVFGIFYLFILYYSLHISLLDKSLLMIVSGSILLAGGQLFPRWSGSLS